MRTVWCCWTSAARRRVPSVHGRASRTPIHRCRHAWMPTTVIADCLFYDPPSCCAPYMANLPSWGGAHTSSACGPWKMPVCAWLSGNDVRLSWSAGSGLLLKAALRGHICTSPVILENDPCDPAGTLVKVNRSRSLLRRRHLEYSVMRLATCVAMLSGRWLLRLGWQRKATRSPVSTRLHDVERC